MLIGEAKAWDIKYTSQIEQRCIAPEISTSGETQFCIISVRLFYKKQQLAFFWQPAKTGMSVCYD